MLSFFKRTKTANRKTIEEIITTTNGKELSVFINPISIPLTSGAVDVDFFGGLVDRNTNELIKEAVLLRYGKLCQRLPDDSSLLAAPSSVAKHSGVFLFGGVLLDNFGHFLLESLGRLWSYSLLKEVDPFIFFYAPWGIPDYKNKGHYMYQTFTALNIPVNKIVFFNGVVQLEQVIVPEQKYGFGACRTPDKTFVDFIRTFQLPERIKKRGAEKLYISRSQLPLRQGRPIAETLFEEHLKGNGYMVIYPEKISIFEQLNLYKQARKIIFCDGGATYCNILLPEFPAEIAVIARRRDPRWNYKEITDHFLGYKKNILWIDEVKGQYQFGMETWDALADVDWNRVSNALHERDFIETIFEVTDAESYKSIKQRELLKYIQSIESHPLFLQYMEKQVENHPLLPNSF